MRIVPAGKYESALVRIVDELLRPDRNWIGHLYYMDLNRSVDRAFTDGVGTFAALFEGTVVPWQLDWTDKSSGEEHIDIGIKRSPSANRDDKGFIYHRHQQDALIKQVCERSILSCHSIQYITNLDLSSYPNDILNYFNKNRESKEREILRLYLKRLLDQVYAASDLKDYLLISEFDIHILKQIGRSLIEGKLTTEIPFPNLQNRLIEPNAFAHGVLNFSPKDVRTLEHVRADSDVRRYGRQIQALLKDGPMGPDDPSITDALIDAYYRTKAGRKAKTIFEIETWVVKPLHYVPVIGEVLTIAEDVKDLVQKGVDIKMKQYEWWMIGVRMQELAIDYYLSRLSNNRHPALRNFRDT